MDFSLTHFKLITALFVSSLILIFFALPSHADTVDVSIENFNFVPQSITIDVGDAVRWTNNDGVAHTTTSEEGVWDSGNMNQGDTFVFTFNSTGEYPYICTIHPFMTGTVTVETATDVEQSYIEGLPESFAVNQNHPNPFNPTTTISYQLPENSKVNIKVFNIAGQLVATLIDEEQQAGYHEITWDGRSNSDKTVPSGVYLYRVRTDNGSIARKMMMLK